VFCLQGSLDVVVGRPQNTHSAQDDIFMHFFNNPSLSAVRVVFCKSNLPKFTKVISKGRYEINCRRLCFSLSHDIVIYRVLKANGNDKINGEKSQKKVIPLHKTYIWGIVFCLTALVCIIMYNVIRSPVIPSTPQDYLALVRDNHDRVAAMRGITHSGGMTLGDLQDLRSDSCIS
jgi:hypothetical protein